MISLTIEQNSETISSWFSNNQNWIIPLLVTVIFSIINIVFAVINANNAKEQRKMQQLNARIDLFQKRLDVFQKEKIVLESFIENEFPSREQLTDLCHAQHESYFLFDVEVKNHIEKVCELAMSFDENVGLNNDGIFNDLYMKECSEKAIDLFADAISIYSKYLDFCNVGIITEKNKSKKDR